jgi:uroporphyrinogen-III synthase
MVGRPLQMPYEMNQNNISILSTRPLAYTFMEEAEANGVHVDVLSFIETKNTIDKNVGTEILKLAAQEVAVVFTSMNAAEAVIDCLKAINAEPGWTIYTLGGITNTIISGHFTGSEIFGESINAKQVAEAIIENEEKEVFFFCGNQRRNELPDMLHQHQIKVTEIEVYQTIDTPVKIKQDYSGILFFSPSAVRSFFSVNNCAASTILFAIGTTTAEELKKHATNKVLIGSQPHKEFLARQAMDYLIKNVEVK